MTNRTFITVHGVIYTVFAFALFFGPTMMWPMYGVQINDQYALFLSQHTSIFLGGIAAVSLMLRDVEQHYSQATVQSAVDHESLRRGDHRLRWHYRCVCWLWLE